MRASTVGSAHPLGVLALTCTPTASPHLLLQVVTLENVAMYLAVVNPNPNPNPNPNQVRPHAHRRRSGQSVHLAAVRAVCPRSYWCASQAWRAGAARCALSRVRGGRRRVSVGRNECVVGASCVMLDEVVMCSEFRRESVLLSLGVKPCF